MMLTLVHSYLPPNPFRDGRLVWTAWLTRGMVSKEIVAARKFGGGDGAVS